MNQEDEKFRMNRVIKYLRSSSPQYQSLGSQLTRGLTTVLYVIVESKRRVIIEFLNRITGIGVEVARDLIRRGCRVWLACRDLKRGREVANDLGGDCRPLKMDLCSLESVKRAARELSENEPRLDLLINNAAVIREYKSRGMETAEENSDKLTKVLRPPRPKASSRAQKNSARQNYFGLFQ